MRHVICHYHIYKNSGTTFDGILAGNFGDRHVCFDGPFPYFSINQQELGKVIGRHRSAIAFSSHQVALPVPASLDFNVLPVVFVRHPILRIYSIYKFKRNEDDGTVTSRHAMEMDFDAWCRHGLAHQQEITQISNAQTRVLARVPGMPVVSRRSREGMVYDLYQARRNLMAVELLARTEHFARDVSRFPALLARHGIAFEVSDTTPRNVTASNFGKSVPERLAEVAGELPEATLAALQAANRQDQALYDDVAARLDACAVDHVDHVDQADGVAEVDEADEVDGLTSSAEIVTDPSSESSSSS